MEPIQLLEGKEYRYELKGIESPEPLRFSRPEIFFPDDESQRTGRLRPGLRTGTIPVEAHAGERLVGNFAIEVRSRKFDYLKHYRWMLRDLAQLLTELIMQRFATAEQRFTIDAERDAVTLYQRFALLQSLLNDEHLRGALRQVLYRPHVTWERESETRKIQRGLRGSASALRELARPGPRVDWEHGSARLDSVPRTVRSSRTFSTLDNRPNRFVKFALFRWRNVIAQIRGALERESDPSNPILRGIEETTALQQKLDALLGEELFRDVGELNHFPANSQVLQKRTGYRAIYQTYVQFELASSLSWAADDVYGAGQRNVATLYEYWAFLQLVQIVSELCAERFNVEQLFDIQDDRLGIRLRRGTEMQFEGIATAAGGRRMRLQLHFNKRFAEGSGSWTRNMRPDCSLRVTPVENPALFEDIWLHFDAKYRLEEISAVFFNEEEPEDRDTAEDAVLGTATREDLLKMHAYRDAIRRSAGAYVLYPGNTSVSLPEYHEILPGLGAFPFYPTEPGRAGGTSGLTKFLKDVLNHAASQVTQHERDRYWRNESYREDEPSRPKALPPAPFLPRPPADTLVLLGYVKSREHREWIQKHRLYNLRADEERDGSVGLGARELATDLALLHGPDGDHAELWKIRGEPRIWGVAELRELEYPEPRGERYFVLPLEKINAAPWSEWCTSTSARHLVDHLRPGSPEGTPAVSTWLRFVAATWGRNWRWKRSWSPLL